MYWQFYDYFFAPNGSFYGTRKACEPLHVQYAYDDGSVQVVNGLYKDFTNLSVSAKLFNSGMEQIWTKDVKTDIKADESKKVISKEWPENPEDVFFLKLTLKDAEGKEISSNFYWLSSKGDANADFTSLNKLPQVSLKYSVQPLQKANGKYSVKVDIENTSNSLAFSVNPKILKAGSKELVLPVFWDDNYFSMLPAEKRQVTVQFSEEDLGGEAPVLAIDGWNIAHVEKELK
jgi:exo-1,4-beta-D-glucosaminidase